MKRDGKAQYPYQEIQSQASHLSREKTSRE